MEFRNFREIVLPSNLKLADITPVYKKRLNASQKRIVSVLPIVSKMCEQIIEKQLSTHI